MTSESTEDLTREKRETLERFLNDEHALVHISPRVDGVKLPDHLVKSPTVTLKLSRLFSGRMDISPAEVSAELLFGNSYFKCRIPFPSIWGMTSYKGQFLMWPDSTPAEVLASLERQSQARRSDAEQPKAPADSAASPEDSPQRPKLRRVK